MTSHEKNIAHRLDILSAELSSLKIKTAQLEEKIASLADTLQIKPSPSPSSATTPETIPKSPIPVSFQKEKQWSWVTSVSLLPQVAAVCFILVVALVLRTLTDNEIIATETGSFLGMAYSTILIGAGWNMLSKGIRLGRVFPVCGALLLYSIVWETHSRFESIASTTAYSILFLALLALTATSFRFKITGLNCLGIISTSIVGVSIDFPNPHFPSLLLLLWAVNINAYMSSRKDQRCNWTRWIVFFITIFIWFSWSSTMRVPLRNGIEMDAFLNFAWFFPMLVFFLITYLGMSTIRAADKIQQMNSFDMALPTFNVLWAYAAALLIVSLLMESTFSLGVIGVFVALLHFSIAVFFFWRSRVGGPVSPGICVFTFAGATLLVLALPAATGNMLFSLVLWSALGLVLARLSGVCEIGGIRLTSYLLQTTACIFGIVSGSLSMHAASPFASILTAGLLMTMAGFQYHWCRKQPIACSSGFFNRFDPSDHSAVILLLVTLINCFILLNLTVFLLFSPLAENIDNVMLGSQSIFINIGAMVLMLIALPKKNKELMGMAIFIVIIGAMKVFGYDLFEAHGVPLVMSVFSFGALAAAGSVIIKRWQHIE
jgi:hypothetical protein